MTARTPAHERRVPIRSSDMSEVGHAHNASYLIYAEEVTREFLDRLFGVDYVLAHVELDYLGELVYADGEVVAKLYVEGVGRSSVEVGVEMEMVDGTTAARARCVFVARDPETHRSRPLTDGERSQLIALVADRASPEPPPLHHVGIVVGDIEAALASPGFAFARPLGAPSDLGASAVVGSEVVEFRLRGMFASLGPVLLELLQPLDDRSPHARFLAERGGGLHHLGFFVDSIDMRSKPVEGRELLVDATGPGNPSPWAYFAGSSPSEPIVELLQRTPSTEKYFARLQRL